MSEVSQVHSFIHWQTFTLTLTNIHIYIDWSSNCVNTSLITGVATSPRTAERKSPGILKSSIKFSQSLSQRCFKCYNSGHLAKDCDEPDLCYHCNKVDPSSVKSHSHTLITHQLTIVPPQRGHMSRDCPDGELKTCFKCGGKGHIAMDCPSPANTTTEARGKKVEKGSGATDGVSNYLTMPRPKQC